MSAKFAPCLRARAIWKSKSLKAGGVGTFFEVQSVFRVAGVGISTRCKIRGRRRSSWGLQKRWQAWGIWRGSETMRFAWQAQWFRALWCRCLKPPTLKPWRGCKFHVTEVLLCSDHFAWQLQDFVCLGSTFSWQAQYFWNIHLKIVKTYWTSEVKCLVNMSFLKEVSRFFWRTSRRKVSFDKIIGTTHQLTTKSLEPQTIWHPNHLNLKSIDNQLIWISNRLTTKSFESQINWQPTHLNLKSIDNQITWISDQLTTNSFESQIDWQPNHLNLRSIDNQTAWISNPLTTNSLESQIGWRPNHLNLKSTDNQINWISNRLTTKITWISDNQTTWISNPLTTNSLESQIGWRPNHLNLKSIIDNQITWIPNQLTTKSFESQIRWQPNHLTLNSFESDINWLSNHLNSAHPLPTGSLSLETFATALCGRYVSYICTYIRIIGYGYCMPLPINILIMVPESYIFLIFSVVCDIMSCEKFAVLRTQLAFAKWEMRPCKIVCSFRCVCVLFIFSCTRSCANQHEYDFAHLSLDAYQLWTSWPVGYYSGLTLAQEGFRNLRAAEIKHGRVAENLILTQRSFVWQQTRSNTSSGRGISGKHGQTTNSHSLQPMQSLSNLWSQWDFQLFSSLTFQILPAFEWGNDGSLGCCSPGASTTRVRLSKCLLEHVRSISRKAHLCCYLKL